MGQLIIHIAELSVYFIYCVQLCVSTNWVYFSHINNG